MSHVIHKGPYAVIPLYHSVVRRVYIHVVLDANVNSLLGGFTPKDLIQRVRNLEQRLLQLESCSPEYSASLVNNIVCLV